MKKLIYIFILMASIGYSQQTDFIKVLSVTDTVNVGDSITIKFTKSYNAVGNGMSRLQLWTASYLQDCMYKSSAFLSDTNTVKVKIIPSMGTGSAKIYSNATIGGYKPFYITNTVGIKENTINADVINIQYYDIYGKEKPSINEGLNIRLTTYSNGYIKKDKVISQP